jgi:molybdopterin-guanine dinucleotide biosynthesis protein A
VLCGGASTRMGRDKALIQVGETTMVERVCAVLAAAGCDPVVLVGGDRSRLAAATGREIVGDTWPGEGPLGGVIDAVRWFAARGAEAVVIAACDLPDLTVDAVHAVADGAAATVAVAERRHPSLARWPVGTIGQLEALFGAGVRSLHEALDALGASDVAVDAAALRNVNTPDELR